jgi:hypothetical protein
MEKQTKNIITREEIEQDLLFNNTASIKHTAVCLAAVVLVWGVISAIFLSLLPSGFLWLDVIIWVFFIGIVGAPVWAISAMLIKALIERKHLKNGELEIVVRPLLYKEEKMVRGSDNFEKVFHFKDFEEVLADSTHYQLSIPGDVFYIVHYRGSRDAKFVFPLKLYEYKEEEKE